MRAQNDRGGRDGDPRDRDGRREHDYDDGVGKESAEAVERRETHGGPGHLQRVWYEQRAKAGRRVPSKRMSIVINTRIGHTRPVCVLRPVTAISSPGSSIITEANWPRRLSCRYPHSVRRHPYNTCPRKHTRNTRATQ